MLKLEAQRMEGLKMDMTFEVAHQIFLNLILVLFANSEVRYIYTFSLLSLVYLHFSLVNSILAIFSSRMATGMISQIIECYQFSCQLAVPQKR